MFSFLLAHLVLMWVIIQSLRSFFLALAVLMLSIIHLVYSFSLDDAVLIMGSFRHVVHDCLTDPYSCFTALVSFKPIISGYGSANKFDVLFVVLVTVVVDTFPDIPWCPSIVHDVLT